MDEVEVGDQIIRVGDFLEGHLEHFRLGVSGDLAEGAVDLEPSSLGRDQGHADGSMIEGISEACFGMPERLLGA